MKEYKFKINNNDYIVNILSVEDSNAEVEVNGINFNVEFDHTVKKPKSIATPTKTASNTQTTVSRPSTPVFAPEQKAASVASGQYAVASPLPGVILEVNVKLEDSVKKGDKLLVLEAMKMENVIESPKDGKITEIKVNKGDSVLEGAPLIVIE